MAYKSIVSVTRDEHADKSALLAAGAMAAADDGHLDVFALGIDSTDPGFYYAGATAIAVQDNYGRAVERSSAVADAARALFVNSDLSHGVYPFTTRADGVAGLMQDRAALADLAVLPKPFGEGRGIVDELILEAALYSASIPVLVIPPAATFSVPVKRVLVAWNESREALKAIRAALPLLQRAEIVEVGCIDPPRHPETRTDVGSALSLMLARHGVTAEVNVVPLTLNRVSDTLLRTATDQGSELIVMGAYGHSRLREFMFGGVSRDILAETELPLFMAR